VNKTLGAPGLASETWENTIPRGRGTGSARPTPPSNCRHTPAQPPKNTKAPETGVSGASSMVNSQVHRAIHRPAQPSNGAPSLLASRIFRLGRRGESPGRPESSLLRLHQRMDLRLHQRMDLRVSSNLAPSSAPGNGVSGCPDARILRLCRFGVFGSPQICLGCWADNDSRPDSKLASPAMPRMNLRAQPAPAHSRLTLDAFSTLSGLSLAGQASCVLPSSVGFCIVLPGWNCVSNSLQGHQLESSVIPFNLWKQVQKTEFSVDFTKISALIRAGSWY